MRTKPLNTPPSAIAAAKSNPSEHKLLDTNLVSFPYHNGLTLLDAQRSFLEETVWNFYYFFGFHLAVALPLTIPLS